MDIVEEMDGLYSSANDPWNYSKINRFPILLGLINQFGIEGEVLEIGCGEGLLTRMLPDRFKVSYTGIDVSGVAIDRAMKRFSKYKGMSWVVDDVSKHKFSSKFSMIIVSDVYPYLDNILRFHEKTIGLLNKGGILVSTSCSSSFCGSEMFPALELQDKMTVLFTGKSLTRSLKKEYESEYYVGRKK